MKKKYKVDFINSGYKRYFQAHEKEIMAALRKCYANGDFVLREDLEKFEINLEKFLGVKHAIGVASGTDALKIAYKALGCGPGDEVITVSHTFIAPIEEIVQLGARPVLIDVRKDALMDVSKIEAAITPKTVGIVPVHLSGKVCDMKEIMRIAKKHKLWVVEDACQALGASLDGKKAGTIGNAGCFSFIAPKTLGAGGDGGGIVTNDTELYDKMRLLRNHSNITQGVLHGHQPKAPKQMIWGYNSRLDNIMAAVLNIKLTKYYRGMLARRKKICKKYIEVFKKLPIGLPTEQPEQIYQEMIIRVPDAWKFKAFMDSQGVEVLVRDTVTNHKMYEWYFGKISLPVSEAMATSAVRIPCYPEMTEEEVNTVIEAVKKFYAQK